jgi:hypothetical protein
LIWEHALCVWNGERREGIADTHLGVEAVLHLLDFQPHDLHVAQAGPDVRFWHFCDIAMGRSNV